MGITFLRDGISVQPEHSTGVHEFCERQKIDVSMEWRKGQYWLCSDLPGENPIGIEVDRELERHLEYFKRSSLQKELLARAIGVKGPHRPKVLDLTAGLLGDSLLFLAMGCEVVAIERHPVIAFLLRSALSNAHHPLLQKLHFREEDALSALKGAPEVEVIFYDPMFEDPNQKSLPRKEMRIFRTLVGSDQDTGLVMNEALKLGVRRLVVKRPRLSVPVVEGRPVEFVGKATRYDVYLGQSGANHIK